MIRASALSGASIGMTIVSALNGHTICAVGFLIIAACALTLWRAELQREAV
jgi:hypothetical protein